MLGRHPPKRRCLPSHNLRHLRLLQHPQYMFTGNFAPAGDTGRQFAVGLQPRRAEGKKPTHLGTNLDCILHFPI
jgi:hypothetical protein